MSSGPTHAVPAVLAAAAILALTCAPGTADNGMSPDRLEAVMLLQVSRFVTWPPNRPQGSEMRFCVVGDSRLAEALMPHVAKETVHGKPMTLVKLFRIADIDGCDVVWLGAVSERDFAAASSLAERNGVLTVSDLDTFTARGGMVAFVPRGGRMSIEVNREAADHAGLQFSSKLLKLARLIRTAGVR